ncbi:hypothetical protein AVEN_147386-1 [Araneus ventricosus]|uniref:Uncharacterized protein n=1 Tax=Araneus ventricosus TaxID=182803 RepID=A0A4Y2FTN2_ARAVE|nr:hypothetical protein AVEN_147386-1 [Araneus ventricosus]
MDHGELHLHSNWDSAVPEKERKLPLLTLISRNIELIDDQAILSVDFTDSSSAGRNGSISHDRQRKFYKRSEETKMKCHIVNWFMNVTVVRPAAWFGLVKGILRQTTSGSGHP